MACGFDHKRGAKIIPEQKVAQAVVNAAWTKFNAIDKQTWPKHTGICFVECTEYANPHLAIFHDGVWRCLDYSTAPLIHVTLYANPQDLRKSELLNVRPESDVPNDKG